MSAQSSHSERGQAIVLLALALVGLLGFAALAIDGGNLYTEQRRAQAAADNAVMAAASAKMRGTTAAAALRDAALDVANTNGYADGLDGARITVNQPPSQGAYQGNSDYIEVIITQDVSTALVHFVYQGPVQVTVTAVGLGHKQDPPQAGYALITLRDCRDTSDPDIEVTGGGNDGAVWTFQGGIWINTTETGASNDCGLDPGSSSGNDGIRAFDGYPITSTGGYDYVGHGDDDKISPLPVETGANGGSPLPDPLADLPEPTCSGNGSGAGTAASPWQPGNYGGSGQPSLGAGIMSPGLYCVTGDIHLSGHSTLQGTGVVLYMRDGQITFTGQAELYLTAPTTGDCLGTAGDTSASCTYAGIVFFAARDHCGEVIDVGGNGEQHYVGTVYAPCATFNAHGGGNSPEDATVRGQLIVGRVLVNGGSDLTVWYDASVAYQLPPYVQLVQ
jgi:hypothetical protein